MMRSTQYQEVGAKMTNKYWIARATMLMVLALILSLGAVACGGGGGEKTRRSAEELDNDPMNHYRWAREQHLRGYYQEALDSIDKAIALDETGYLYYNERGLINLNAGQPEEALLDFQKVAELNPLYTDVHNNMGATLARLGRNAEARVEFEKVIKDPLYPNRQLAFSNLGDMLYAAGDYEGAIQELRRAVAIDKKYQRAHYTLGLCYQALGQIESARDSFEEVVRIDPYSERAREVQQILDDLDLAS
jgi:Tfp pilus assembly protein PilF